MGVIGWERNLRGRRVLVVDDDDDIRELVAAIIASCGAHVEQCRSASEALDVWARDHFDVLLSDIEMPGGDGYSLVERIRAMPAPGLSSMRAVAMTARNDPATLEHAFLSGFDDFLGKPFELTELTAVLAEGQVRM